MLHDALAQIFAYPGGDGRDRIRAALRTVDRPDLAPFLRFVEETDTVDLEEAYTRTFDINPVCTLEVGWHLYGEDYSRGAFLVRMRERMRRCGVEETTELPDHLTSVLALLGRLDEAEAKELACTQVLPAIGKMLEGFPDEADPYRCAVAAVQAWLRERYGEEAPAPAAMGPAPYETQCGGCTGLPGRKLDG